jgi:hypothetical protein
MLDHVSRRATRHGITTIAATKADARDLPYADGLFDAVYLVTALGEIPFGRLHQAAAASGLHFDSRRGTTLAYLARFRQRAASSPLFTISGNALR